MLIDCGLQRCGRLDDQISLLKHKLQLIHQGHAFNGKRTKTARSQGRKFQVTLEQEATRLLVSFLHRSIPSRFLEPRSISSNGVTWQCVRACRATWGGR
jgi:hypothetical protein